MSRHWTPVIGGTFSCPYCGATWVGTWHGAKEDITCVVCKELIFEEKDADK